MKVTRRIALGLGAAFSAMGHAAAADDPARSGRIGARPGTPAPPYPPKGFSLLKLDGDPIRDALLYVPAAFDPATPIPLLVMLHGAGMNGARMMKLLSDAAEARGILLLTPTSRGITWDLRNAPACSDAAFIDRALARVFGAATVDPRRVGLGGLSDGASFALSLGIANGDLFGEVMAFSPGFLRVPVRNGKPRIFLSHGRADEVLPFALSREIAHQLERDGFDVEFRAFDGGHWIPKDGFHVALDGFLR